MTPAQHNLCLAMCERAAECWAAGAAERADGWFGAALEMVGTSEFIDTDEPVDR